MNDSAGRDQSAAVLVVDDNPFNREMLKTMLLPEGFSIDEGKNGKEALAHMEHRNYALIFMDLLMPGMDGFETIRRIRDLGVHTPIVIISAMSSREDRTRCLEAGGDEFLPKPFQAVQIRELVERYRSGRLKHLPTARDSADVTEVGGDGNGFSDRHVLLLEEDGHTAARFQAVLSRVGIKTTHVTNGNMALKLIGEYPGAFNVISANVYAPGIDGLGVLAQVKPEHPDTLVFLYADTYDADTFHLANQLGADGIHTLENLVMSFPERIKTADQVARRRGSSLQTAATAGEVRKAQAQLIKFGCPNACDTIDIAFTTVTDAGGDLAVCRRFNREGRCGVFLGDVSGHSVISSYVSAMCLGVLSTSWDRRQRPIELLKTLNGELVKPDYDRYHLCANALLWERRLCRIETATAGNPGVLVAFLEQNKPVFRSHAGGGMCLGLIAEDHLFLSETFSYAENEVLFLHSDGIRQVQLVAEIEADPDILRRKTPRGLSREILDRILEKHGQQDDMVLVTLFFTDSVPRCIAETYNLESRLSAVDGACRWFMDRFGPHEIPPGQDPYFVQLAVREALINAVLHGNREDPETRVTLSVSRETDALRVDVTDRGPGFSLPKPIRNINEIPATQPRGRGLAVISALVDQLTVNGSTVSLLFKNREKPSEYQPPADKEE